MIWRGFYFYRRRMDRRRVLRALLFLTMVLALTVAFIAATQMRPLLESMATTRVSNTVTRSSVRRCMRPSRRASCSMTVW